MSAIENMGDTTNIVFKADGDKVLLLVGNGGGTIGEKPGVFIGIQRALVNGKKPKPGTKIKENDPRFIPFGNRVCLWFDSTESLDVVMRFLQKAKKDMKKWEKK